MEHIAMQPLRFFRPGVNVALFLALATVMVAGNLYLITQVHEARRVAQAACAAQARAEIARKPILVHTVRLADDCQTLRRMRGDLP